MSNDLTPRRIQDLLKKMRDDIDLIRRQLVSVTVRLPGRLSPQGQETSDWNMVITPGFFWSTGSANGPSTGLNVGIVTVGDGSVIQRVSTTDAARVWVRRSADNGATWSPWVLEMSRHITDSASNGRAYVGTGATATGNGETYMGMSPDNGMDTSTDAIWWAWPTTTGAAPGTKAALTKAGDLRLPVSGGGHIIAAPVAYAQASGSATTSAGGSVTVTFPSGRFNVTPNIAMGSMVTGGLIYCSAKSATSATFQGRTVAGAALAMAFDWTATQMNAGSASG